LSKYYLSKQLEQLEKLQIFGTESFSALK